MANDSIYSALLFYHLGAVEDEDKDLNEMFEKLDDPDLVIPYVKTTKEKGNDQYKSKKFAAAYDTYSKAIKCLCCVVPDEHEDDLVFKGVAISLNLNLAVCALKLHKPNEAIMLCSLVLELDDKNVKALYSRAQASKEIGNLEGALEDLRVAKRIEPQNKEFNKELQEIQGVITSLTNNLIQFNKANQVQEVNGNEEEARIGLGNDPKADKATHFERKRKINLNDTKTVFQKSKTLRDDKMHEFVQKSLKGASEDQSQGQEHCDNFTLVNPQITSKSFYESNQVFEKRTFVHRRRRNSTLSISCADFNKLKEGENLVVYHPNSLTVMRIRAIHPKTSEVMETTQDDTMKDAVVHEENHTSSELHVDSPMELEKHPHAHIVSEIEHCNSELFKDKSEIQQQYQKGETHVGEVLKEVDTTCSSKFHYIFAAVKKRNYHSAK